MADISSSSLYAFDLFGTLIHEKKNGPSYQDLVLSLPAAAGFDYSRTKTKMSLFVRDVLQVQPEVTTQSMVDQLLDTLELQAAPSEKQRIVEAWLQESTTAEWYDDSLYVLNALKERINSKIALITNVSAPAWTIVNRKFDLEGRFDAVFPSCVIGFSKPNEKIWEQVEKKYPDCRYVMIGDSFDDDIQPTLHRDWSTHWLKLPGVKREILR